MSETFGAIDLAATGTNTLLTFVAGAFVLARYHWNRLRQSVFWGTALLFLGLTNFMEFGYNANLVAANVASFLLENNFLSFSIILLYCGCALFYTRRRLYTALLPSLFLMVQEINMVYFYLIANYQSPIVPINVAFFGIPIAIFSGYSFLLDYLASKRRASLVISISSWMYGAGMGPATFLGSLTPYKAVLNLMSALTIVVMFVGFVMLALSKEKQSVIERDMRRPAAKPSS